jgi:hypothetical protein
MVLRFFWDTLHNNDWRYGQQDMSPMHVKTNLIQNNKQTYIKDKD